MKFLSTIIVSMTSGLVFEPMNVMQTNHAPNIEVRSQPSVLVPRSRNKRDLIGFNRQANNNFSHGRHWDNRMGKDIRTMLQNVADQEEAAVRSLIFERKRQQEQAILNRISYLKQHCTCYLFCTGSKQACEELMRLETKLSNGLN